MAAKKTSQDAPQTPWAVDVFTHTIAFVPGAHRMLTGHALSNEIIEWDIDTGEQLGVRRKGRKTKDGVNQIVFRKDGAQFIAVDQSGMAGSTSFVRVWAYDASKPMPKKPEPELELLGHKGPVASCAYLDDGRALTGGRDNSLRLWDLAEGGQQLSEMSHDDQVVALVVAPDGKTALTAGWDNVTDVKHWDVEKGEQLGVVATFATPCCALAFSPDHTKLACLTYDGALHVLDWTSSTRATLWKQDKAHDKDGQASVSWSPDSAHVVTASQFDETVRAWSAADGAPVGAPVKLARPNLAAWGPDGVIYVALAYTGIARFRLESGALAQIT